MTIGSSLDSTQTALRESAVGLKCLKAWIAQQSFERLIHLVEYNTCKKDWKIKELGKTQFSNWLRGEDGEIKKRLRQGPSNPVPRQLEEVDQLLLEEDQSFSTNNFGDEALRTRLIGSLGLGRPLVATDETLLPKGSNGQKEEKEVMMMVDGFKRLKTFGIVNQRLVSTTGTNESPEIGPTPAPSFQQIPPIVLPSKDPSLKNPQRYHIEKEEIGRSQERSLPNSRWWQLNRAKLWELLREVLVLTELSKAINGVVKDLGLPIGEIESGARIEVMAQDTLRIGEMEDDKKTEKQRIQDKEDKGSYKKNQNSEWSEDKKNNKRGSIGVKKSPIKAR
ncbi:hypothetical protein BY996DRAFT_6531333, partial [Phakopsora pachyrhizi]